MKNRKGIILAGGMGTRLYPATSVISKQILPIYDKPTIYYALSTLMLSKIKDIFIISSPRDLPAFQSLLGDGSHIGININYGEQLSPKGLAEALIIAEKFLDGCPSCMILGDNIFYGGGLSSLLENANNELNTTIFTYQVSDPSKYGILEVNNADIPVSVIEKPQKPSSNLAITGLYFFDENASKYARAVKPSKRGELEITDVIAQYIKLEKLKPIQLSRGIAWLDTGTSDALFEASLFVSTIQKRTGLKICCPEEIAWRNGWISDIDLNSLGQDINQSEYGKYLINLLK